MKLLSCFGLLLLSVMGLSAQEQGPLQVIAPQTGSERWFGIYHYP